MVLFRAVPVIIVILFMAACMKVVSPVADNGITGIYYLLKVDGTTLPGTVSHDGVMLTVSSGSFIISADGTCVSTTRFTAPGGREETREVRAKYVLRNSKLIMTWEGAGITEGSVAGDTFIMDNHGMIFEYSRNPQ